MSFTNDDMKRVKENLGKYGGNNPSKVEIQSRDMTPFTDDDLERLEERLDDPLESEDAYFLRHRGKALLARLEAAEKLAEEFSNWKDTREHLNCDSSCSDKPYFDGIRTAIGAWRKAAGKSVLPRNSSEPCEP